LGFGITLIMGYMDNRYKSCETKKLQLQRNKVLFDYANITPVIYGIIWLIINRYGV